MNIVGPIGPLTVTDAQGQVLENSGVIRLRLGPTGSDSLLFNRPVTPDGSLNLVLQPGFDPVDGAQFVVAEWPGRTGTFRNIFGEGRLYDPTYTTTELTVGVRRSAVQAIGPGAFSGGSTSKPLRRTSAGRHRRSHSTGSPIRRTGRYWRATSTRTAYFAGFPDASGETALNDFFGFSVLQMEFSTPVRRVGMLVGASLPTTFLMKAFDNDLNEIGVVSAALTAGGAATFIGLEAPVNVRRVVITEAGTTPSLR